MKDTSCQDVWLSIVDCFPTTSCRAAPQPLGLPSCEKGFEPSDAAAAAAQAVTSIELGTSAVML